MENRVIDVLKNLRVKKEISIEQFKDLSSLGSTLGMMHGSAKVHKIVTDGLPSFRSILSAIGTPTYKLAEFLAPMLEPLTTNECTIKDPFIFSEELQSFDSKLAMVSFDIESLFTNITLQETIELCVENLFKDRTHVDNLSKYSFDPLAKFLPTLSRNHATCCLPYYIGHRNFAQSLNSFIRKLTS